MSTKPGQAQIARMVMRKYDAAFASMGYSQALALLGSRKKPSAVGTAARWSCAVGAFGESDFGAAKRNFREATAERRTRKR